jgi:hypothetical protein
MRSTNSKGVNATGRKDSNNSFAGIPRRVMESEDYIGLTSSAKSLLLELAYQYRGKNNGDLTAAWSVMRSRGWRSPVTVRKALKQLIDSTLVYCTREGQFTNPGGVCALYAVAWRPIDECKGKHHMKPTRVAPRNF